MKPAPFRYFAPASLDEALALLQEHGWDARPLAGGQSLIPAMNFRLAQPAVLVDLGRIDGLASIEETPDGGLRIGAMTRQSDLERSDVVARCCPLLHETMPAIAHSQIRNRGTIGGSLAHADPAAELPAVILALEGILHLRSPSGERRVPASEFFYGLMATAIEPGELLVAVELPPTPPGAGSAFEEFSRRHGDYALVGCATQIVVDGDGTVADARVVLISVGDTALLSTAAAEALHGQRPDAALISAAAEAASRKVDPPGDIHASPDYRRHLVGVMVRRTLTRALARAGSDPGDGAGPGPE
jgi:CO/xanthine dehydrogenase FAD-binding subunit